MQKRIFVLTDIHICTHVHYVARKPSQHGAGNGLSPCNMAGLLPVPTSTFASFSSFSCSVPHVLVSHCYRYFRCFFLVFFGFFSFFFFLFLSFLFSFHRRACSAGAPEPPSGRLLLVIGTSQNYYWHLLTGTYPTLITVYKYLIHQHFLSLQPGSPHLSAYKCNDHWVKIRCFSRESQTGEREREGRKPPNAPLLLPPLLQPIKAPRNVGTNFRYAAN